MAVTDGEFAVAAMPVPRAEYLARSLSRRQPWVAEGISRRQWERRRKMPSATSAPAASPPAVTSTPAKEFATAKAARMTRAEYLAGSLSKQQLWLDEGISRRTGERRWRNIAVPGAPADGIPTANVGSQATKAPCVRFGPPDGMTQVPTQKRLLRRHDEDLLMRRIYAYWDGQDMTPSDPQSLAQAIHAITVPEPFKHMDGRALGKVYRRARGRLPWDTTAGLAWSKNGTNRTTAKKPATLSTAFSRCLAIVRSEFSTECLNVWRNKSATTCRT
jgi:hypothetical protein